MNREEATGSQEQAHRGTIPVSHDLLCRQIQQLPPLAKPTGSTAAVDAADLTSFHPTAICVHGHEPPESTCSLPTSAPSGSCWISGTALTASPDFCSYACVRRYQPRFPADPHCQACPWGWPSAMYCMLPTSHLLLASIAMHTPRGRLCSNREHANSQSPVPAFGPRSGPVFCHWPVSLCLPTASPSRTPLA